MNRIRLGIGLGTLLAAVVISGCNIGMAPPAMSREEAKSQLDKLSPQDKIRYYEGSPMPAEQKRAKIAEIEKQYGIKASDVVGQRPTGTGTNQ